MSGLLDTGSQTTLLRHRHSVSQHYSEYMVKDPPAMIKLKAANGLHIPCLGYVTMDFVIEGHEINPQGSLL